ncbi:protein of unknown function [Methylocella tundrae]|uniref:Uncharacterized protein n=1 Tax=Methylocella tundrae TaxID=227605 RepID=A0A4U8Z3F2_METTU|nr:protein of unknown function [Methylocella tundrae]
MSHEALGLFEARVEKALANPTLKTAIERTTGTAREKRAAAVAEWPDFAKARDLGRRIKDHVVQNLDYYLTEFERNALASGAKVHWATSANEACRIVLDICRAREAKSVTLVEVDARRGNRSSAGARRIGHQASRDGSCRTYRAARGGPPFAHHLASIASHARGSLRALPHASSKAAKQ